MKNSKWTLLVSFAFLMGCSESEPAPTIEISEATPTHQVRWSGVRPLDPELYKVTTAGPLELDNARFLNLPRGFSGNSPPTSSPDGEHFFTYDSRSGFWFGTIDASNRPLNASGRVSGTSLFSPHNVPFVWSEDADAIFGVRQELTSPSGWARGPMSPILITGDGQVNDLPELAHASGGLDRIYWAGGSGLGLAEFGSRGDYYRPEITNPNPVIAFVDTQRGKIIQSTLIPKTRDGESVERLNAVDMRVDGAGKLFALLQFAGDSEGVRWSAWHQDRPLNELESLTVGGINTPFAVSPDTKTILIMHGLSATGIYIQCRNDCPPITPATGTIADLRDLATGRIVWSIDGTAETRHKSLKPAISEDGTLAIIAMPRPSDSGGSSIALISMRNGRIIQQLNDLPSFIDGMGFSKDGKSIWLSGQDLLLTYNLDI